MASLPNLAIGTLKLTGTGNIAASRYGPAAWPGRRRPCCCAGRRYAAG